MGRYAPYIRPKNYFLFTRVSTQLVVLDFDLKRSVLVMKPHMLKKIIVDLARNSLRIYRKS